MDKLNTIDEDTEFETLTKLKGRKRKIKGRLLILEAITGKVLNKIIENCEELGIRKELIDMVKLAFATIAVKNTITYKLKMVI